MFTTFSRLNGREALPKMPFNHQISEIGSPKYAFNTTFGNRPLIGSEMKPASLMISSLGRTHHVLPHVLGQKSEASEPAGEEGELKDQSLQLKDDREPSIPVLSIPEVTEKLQENTKRRQGKQSYRAMYSSIFGGITIDPALMVIPIDDHMVHRGHGVFDTAAIIDGYLYELDAHLDRFLRSASMAKITPPFDLSYIKNVLVKTVAASQCKEGALRFWLTAGPGDFLLSSSGCPMSAFYAVVLEYKHSPQIQGVKVVTSSIPMKPPQFATMKSVNYLPNVLSQMEAQEKGASAAIWFDDDGFVAEGPNMNVAFVNAKKELSMPSFEKILSGCTAKRLLALAPRLMEHGLLNGIQIGNITAEEGKAAEEMMLVGSGVHVLPVVMWDEQPIGTGKEGPVTYALLDLLLEDMKYGPDWVKRILAGGGNVNVPVWGPKFPGVTPLHVAASGGHIKVMDELLEHGANIEARTKGGCGWTPLHNAAKERNKKAVQFLLENGAFLPPDINDGRFNPPLHYCPGLEWAYKIKEKASMSATDGYFDQETCSKG